ncbi:MAG TPA: hypothetical protein VGF24_28370, partial [Vicinamibacterales bacterium]
SSSERAASNAVTMVEPPEPGCVNDMQRSSRLAASNMAHTVHTTPGYERLARSAAVRAGG